MRRWRIRHNTINAYQISEKHLVGAVYETVANYDLLSTIMICLGTKEDETLYWLIEAPGYMTFLKLER